MNEVRNGYDLTRNFYNVIFEKEGIKPGHHALFFWILNLNNRLGWKKEFGLPTDSTMEVLGISNRRTYYKYLKDLEDWEIIKVIQKAKNQHQSNRICLGKKCTGTYTSSEQALTQAVYQALPRHCPGSARIDKPLNNKTTTTTGAEKFEEKKITHQEATAQIKDFVDENQKWVEMIRHMMNFKGDIYAEILTFSGYYLSDPEFMKNPIGFFERKFSNWLQKAKSFIPPTQQRQNLNKHGNQKRSELTRKIETTDYSEYERLAARNARNKH